MAKNKYYVVWHGVQPGIYTTWAECEAQVKGRPEAVYKSFPTLSEAETAFAGNPIDYIKRSATPRPAVPNNTSATSQNNTSLAQNNITPLQNNTSATSQNSTPLTQNSITPLQNNTSAAPASTSAATRRLPANPPDYRHDTVLPLPPEVRAEALAVDAACSGNPGPMEYRGIYLATGQEIFRYGPIRGTNNIGEFLAIVHALALLHRRGRTMTIYTDSRNALLWIKARKCRTKLARTPRTEQVFQLIERAEHWLATHDFSHIPLLKWETKQWGEVPADFGRK